MMVLSESVKNKVEKIRHQFPTEQALLIPLLHFILEEHGWISLDSMRAAAEFLHLPLAKVREVVTFYTMFNQEPVGKVHLQVCTNISCWLNGSDKILEGIEKRLGIKCGQTTQDGSYTLSRVECLASCGTAPVLQANEDYFEGLNPDKIQTLMDHWDEDLKKGKKVGHSSKGGLS
jgi:NADH-quinone oxidoreductase subunit E